MKPVLQITKKELTALTRIWAGVGVPDVAREMNEPEATVKDLMERTRYAKLFEVFA